MDSLQAVGRKSLPTRFGPFSVSTKLATVSMVLEKYRLISWRNTSPCKRTTTQDMGHHLTIHWEGKVPPEGVSVIFLLLTFQHFSLILHLSLMLWLYSHTSDLLWTSHFVSLLRHTHQVDGLLARNLPSSVLPKSFVAHFVIGVIKICRIACWLACCASEWLWTPGVYCYLFEVTSLPCCENLL